MIFKSIFFRSLFSSRGRNVFLQLPISDLNRKRRTADNLDNWKSLPSHFKSKVWTHLVFFALKGKAELDMSKAICKLCNAHVVYCRNTTSLTAHLARHYPEVNVELIAKWSAAASQQILKAALYKLPSGSEKAKHITKSITDFICKGLRPYSVVKNTG